ncbi:unnamed protein product [Bursaphelenchus xylophilus]|uniref:(pine wood nematode) hypothetical protein n=1 Tax=Bursaphelenchus xylophilus TaxID=6326 RepID=A0A1I7SW08_BURXY|nr:unnamed protein product [Bursaphelenchus xylophilus]CAG9098620.1 unnamed protein product [Bursaphelenchus xylophilus]
MKVHKLAASKPTQVEITGATEKDVSRPRAIEPCDFFFRYMFGEFFGTLLLTFLGAYFLLFYSHNSTVSVLSMGCVRFVLMYLFGEVCDAEFNPAISLGQLFCLRRPIFLSLSIISGQLFGAFIGQVLFASLGQAIIPSAKILNTTVQESSVLSFESTLALEITSTFLFVIVFLTTGSFYCMSAVTIITMSLSCEAGNTVRANGNLARSLAQSVIAAIWSKEHPFRHMDAVIAAAIMTPLVGAAVFWVLNSVKEISEVEDDSAA